MSEKQLQSLKDFFSEVAVRQAIIAGVSIGKLYAYLIREFHPEA